jgi:hypothetical protein
MKRTPRTALATTAAIALVAAGACATPQPQRAVSSASAVTGTIDLVNGVETDGATCHGVDVWSYLHAGADVTAFDEAGTAVATVPLDAGVPLDAFDCQWTISIAVPRPGTYDLVIDSLDLGTVNTTAPFALTVESPPHQGNSS